MTTEVCYFNMATLRRARRKFKRKTRLGRSISKEDRAKHKYIANMINGILLQVKNKEKENDNNNSNMVACF